MLKNKVDFSFSNIMYLAFCIIFSHNELLSMENEPIIFQYMIGKEAAVDDWINAGKNLSKNERQKYFNPKNRFSDTPLNYALFCKRFDLAAKLIRLQDVDVSNKDEYGDSPLHISIQEKNVPTILLFLQRKDIKLDLKNNKKETPLSLLNDNPALVCSLLSDSSFISLSQEQQATLTAKIISDQMATSIESYLSGQNVLPRGEKALIKKTIKDANEAKQRKELATKNAKDKRSDEKNQLEKIFNSLNDKNVEDATIIDLINSLDTKKINNARSPRTGNTLIILVYNYHRNDVATFLIKKADLKSLCHKNNHENDIFYYARNNTVILEALHKRLEELEAAPSHANDAIIISALKEKVRILTVYCEANQLNHKDVLNKSATDKVTNKINTIFDAILEGNAIAAMDLINYLITQKQKHELNGARSEGTGLTLLAMATLFDMDNIVLKLIGIADSPTINHTSSSGFNALTYIYPNPAKKTLQDAAQNRVTELETELSKKKESPQTIVIKKSKTNEHQIPEPPKNTQPRFSFKHYAAGSAVIALAVWLIYCYPHTIYQWFEKLAAEEKASL